DIVRHAGRLYLAWRTGPFHFASPDVVMHVVSTEDEKTWRYETSFSLGTDLRECRFLSFNGRLFLYFSVLGTNPLDFQPSGMRVSEYMGPGQWTDPEPVYEEGFIGWRTKTVDGVPYMLAYKGGENIFDFNGEPIIVHWLTTQDGRNWEPVIPGQPEVLRGGTSETDFVFLADGSLVAVSRDEAGDDGDWGMKICRAPATDLGNWECAHDPKKYDSPLLFRHQNDVYLIGRRNLTDTGDYEFDFDGKDTLPPGLVTIVYELDYWVNPKRCSLWRVDPTTLTVEWVLDFPSAGDTCFAAMDPLGNGRYLVYNYTSPYDTEEDPFWLQGQLGPTSIYRISLSLPIP
ncbi:MAG: hypothetical protein KC466_15455, partial [Myxococcales bacterium]|nr:hypothetical protein [Myxococcales bacterium]